MIAISAPSGELLKTIPFEEGKQVGFTKLYGFVSEDAFRERQLNRTRHGFKPGSPDFDFSFRFAGSGEEHLVVDSGVNCTLEIIGSAWGIETGDGTFTVSRLGAGAPLPISFTADKPDRAPWVAFLFTLLIPLAIFLLPRQAAREVPAVILEQVTVKIQPEVQRPVEVSSSLDQIPEIKVQAKETKRAIQQKLGFLGLLGRKDLKKAMGGVPTDLKDVSAGAGQGGHQGSGGELLVGLGQGLKRTTVGNSGVAGLGGVGTRGAGGGAGGYGNTEIGSGEGKGLSTVPLAQELILEGGLDRSVVNATIAKYINQVRACYETGLRRNPALGGQVTMAFEIGGSGELNFANVAKTSLDDAQVESCISQRMLGWKFPKPRGGMAVKVSYPFVLRSTRS